MKLLRTIRLDPSDTLIFDRYARDGEWAVSGAFAFWERVVDALDGKERAAFRSGLLGVDSLGWSTLAIVSEASEAERDAAVERLAAQLVASFGAPGMEMARKAARQEIDFAASLAEPPVGTLVAVQRSVEAGEIRERFRTILPRSEPRHARVLHFEKVEDDPEERVDLMGLKKP